VGGKDDTKKGLEARRLATIVCLYYLRHRGKAGINQVLVSSASCLLIRGGSFFICSIYAKWNRKQLLRQEEAKMG